MRVAMSAVAMPAVIVTVIVNGIVAMLVIVCVRVHATPFYALPVRRTAPSSA